ncbi:MAG: PEP-CTERM sorting domain-containing protein [Planctomycetales bacterium]|nr:PEP-CTERM sorting domain-containing protein [Planctomycetales bacterium]
MSVRATVCLLALMASTALGVEVQTEDNVTPDGSAYLWVEAENAVELGGGNPQDATTGFILVDKDDPIKSISEDANGNEIIKGGLDILPSDTNASRGGAILHDLVGGGNAKWQVQFALPGTYYLYMHYSFFNRDTNDNYGNEDSIYVPPSFNANSRDDWIGYVGVDSNFEDPLEKIGDSNRDGWMPLGKTIVSEGASETHNSTEEDFWDGQFHWAWMDVAVDMDENNAYVGDFGHGIQYEVTDEDVGNVLDFEISTREQYGVIDGLLFATSNELLFDYSQEQMDAFFLNPIVDPGVEGDFNGNGSRDIGDLDLLAAAMQSGDASFDLDGDGDTDIDDRTRWVTDLTNTYYGDSNFDGEFNSSDFVAVFGIAKYETGAAATWAEGDWNGDGIFDSSDFVTAFGSQGYEKGARAGGLQVVPEPNALVLVAFGLLGITSVRRRRA